MTLDPITGLLLLIGFDILLTIAVLDAVLRLQRRLKPSHEVLRTGLARQSNIVDRMSDLHLTDEQKDILVFGSVENARAWSAQWPSAEPVDTHTGDDSRPRNHDPLVDPDPEVSAHMDQHVR